MLGICSWNRQSSLHLAGGGLGRGVDSLTKKTTLEHLPPPALPPKGRGSLFHLALNSPDIRIGNTNKAQHQ